MASSIKSAMVRSDLGVTAEANGFPDCGKYFNIHKRMRPPEIWNRPAQNGSNGTQSLPAKEEPEEKKVKIDQIMPHPPSPSPIRSSPRLHRHSSDQSNTLPPSYSGAGPQESPRKRARKPPPPPSPRMATRSSKAHESVFGSKDDKSANDIIDGSATAPFGDFAFSPSAMFATSPVRGSQSLPDILHAGSAEVSHAPTEDVDLEQLLATFTDSSHPDGDLDLSAIFGTGGGNEVMSQEISDFLSQWEAGLAHAAQTDGAATANGS